MLSLLLCDDTRMAAVAYRHRERIAPASVHVEFGRKGDFDYIGYVSITPDNADKLAGQLREAAAEARRLDAIPPAEPVA